MERESDPSFPRRGTVYPWLVFNPIRDIDAHAITEVNEPITNGHAENIARVLVTKEIVARWKGWDAGNTLRTTFPKILNNKHMEHSGNGESKDQSESATSYADDTKSLFAERRVLKWMSWIDGVWPSEHLTKRGR